MKKKNLKSISALNIILFFFCISSFVIGQTNNNFILTGNTTLTVPPPAGYDKYFYKGTIALKPGFSSVPGKEHRFGPNISLPAGVVRNKYVISYEYNHIGSLTKETVDNVANTPATAIIYSFEYDGNGRLNKVYTQTNAETASSLEATYSYTNDDNVSSLSYPNNAATTYQYDPNRNWLTNTTYSFGGATNFSQALAYYTNGNVDNQTIYNPSAAKAGDPAYLTITYTYDNQNRLASANGGSYNESYGYNSDGAITSKTRTGNSYAFTYPTSAPVSHKLTGVTYNGVAQTIDYDGKGNITYDRTNNAQLQEYTYFNLPLMITKDNYITSYSYNNSASRIYKANDDVDEYYLYDYTGKSLLVVDDKAGKVMANLYGNGMIGKIEDVYNTAPERYYYIKDHLGSIRLTLKKVGSAMNVDNARDYYPYGEVMRNYQNGDPTVNYMFTEKERDAEIESGYDYFGARYYNSKLGMWLQVDPLAEKYPGWSPFNYVINNPMRLIDPNGKWGEEARHGQIFFTVMSKNSFVPIAYSKLLSFSIDVFACGGGVNALLETATGDNIFKNPSVLKSALVDNAMSASPILGAISAMLSTNEINSLLNRRDAEEKAFKNEKVFELSEYDPQTKKFISLFEDPDITKLQNNLYKQKNLGKYTPEGVSLQVNKVFINTFEDWRDRAGLLLEQFIQNQR